MASTNAIAAPSSSSSVSEAGMFIATSSRHATAVDVCDFVYGNSTASPDHIGRFYETNALYENPFITATSRSVIADINSLTRQFRRVDVPRPLAMLFTLFRLKPPESLAESWFQALQVWTEIGDISESESFDGHRKTMIEHTLNVLLLPGIHSAKNSLHGAPSSDSLSNDLSLYNVQPPHPVNTSLPIPGTGLGLPSPFHLQLRILTRLSFNEQGRITHHRDIWDVRDVLGLVPGVSLAHWIGSRLAARGLSALARLFGTHTQPSVPSEKEGDDLERGSYTNVLGLEGVPSAP